MNIIDQIIASKTGDTDFVLTNLDNEWIAAIGNKSTSVALCEVILYGTNEVEFYAEGATADEALSALLAKVVAG